MTLIHDDVLGTLECIDVIESNGSWEFTFTASQGEVVGSMWGPVDAPPAPSLHLMKTLVQHLPAFEEQALEAIKYYIQDDESGVDFPPGEAATDWLALPQREFNARFQLASVRLSDDDQLVLVFATELESESGLGVEFDGQTVVRVDSGGNF